MLSPRTSGSNESRRLMLSLANHGGMIDRNLPEALGKLRGAQEFGGHLLCVRHGFHFWDTSVNKADRWLSLPWRADPGREHRRTDRRRGTFLLTDFL